jgi:hypothetical protein
MTTLTGKLRLHVHVHFKLTVGIHSDYTSRFTLCNQTLVEWSLDGPPPKMCPVIPTSNQDVRQAKNEKRRDEI